MKMQMGFYFDQSRCIGCHACCVACEDWHNIAAGPVKLRRVTELEKGRFPKPSVTFLSISCNHCLTPPCVAVCPAKAISKRKEDGIVIENGEECVGTDNCDMLCRKTCPYEAPQFGNEKNAKILKCDLCIDRLLENKRPICVEACPMEALDAGSLSQLGEKYGETKVAEGFIYSSKIKPSIIFKSKSTE